jgi:hypothetical protein
LPRPRGETMPMPVMTTRSMDDDRRYYFFFACFSM